MPQYHELTDELLQRIEAIFGENNVISQPERFEQYETDGSGVRFKPDLVVKAQNARQVSELLKLANEFRFPVTPRGGGTGLAGGCLPIQGGVVLTLEDMNRVRSIDKTNLIGEVEPGVITQRFREAVRSQGLFYPPDPAGMDKSTLGGNAATNAGGPACVKYGTTKDYILGLEAVLPSGQIIKTGVKTRKGVVGYDLTHLLVGSEGTLGVITSLTFKLIPHPPAVKGITAVFPALNTTMRAVTEILTRGHLPSAMEFLDHKCLALVGEMLPFEIPGDKASLLIVEVDGVAEQIGREIELIGDICKEVGASALLPALTEEGRVRMWEVRRQVSLRIKEQAILYMPEDVAVPIGRISELVDALAKLEEEYSLRIFAFGHAGDGNIHLSIDARRPEEAGKVEEGVRAALSLALQMDGTISGEHGIGSAKKRFLPMEIAPESVELQRGIKKLFDPNMILNPGKLF